ncbi:radical SAM protein [Fulvivirga sp. M361]|uniref:radical SAM protein n=1 Tax=Fulvivirga sp. M361 TaxID=2594266 RepID=UPI00117A7EA7|nr:radical SAM protein [Fulvivirga sp. M361]TRX59412.1 radical SAM protein [Fulvivirga sp. M361]
MSAIPSLKKNHLYRLPWSANDNPIGWVEVTDICNIKCEGCYRLIMGDGHKSLEQIKSEIYFMKKWRNCDNISLAGGEPILHPDIIDIVGFIKFLKMKCVILTNGYALNDSMISQLKKAGLTGFSFHIDTTQIRPEFKKKKIESEMNLSDLRLHYAKMACKAKVNASFGITVHAENYNEVPEFIQWAINNSNLVSGISLITHRMMPTKGITYFANGKEVNVGADSLGYTSENNSSNETPAITSKDLYSLIKSHFPGYEATSYLGGTEDHTSFKWLIGNMIVDKRGRIYGGYGKKAMELIQTFHHFFNGSYLVYPNRKVGKAILLLSPFDKFLRKAFLNIIKQGLKNPIRFFKPLNVLGIGIIQAPDILPDGKIDMCDDCPDMCLHEGKMVNSCRLDECRIYGSFLEPRIQKTQEKPIDPILN